VWAIWKKTSDSVTGTGIKSTNNLPTLKDKKKDSVVKADVKKIEKGRKTDKDEGTAKNTKRDMTPTPGSKKNGALDLSNASVDDKQTPKNTNSNNFKKQQDKKTPLQSGNTTKRGTAVGLSLKSPLDTGLASARDKRNTVINTKKINIDNIEIISKEENEKKWKW